MFLPLAVLVLFLKTINSEIDLRYIDESVDPCEDFYQFACGNFQKYHKRHTDQESLTLYSLTEDELLKIGKKILASPIKRTDNLALKKAKSTFKSCSEIDQLDNLYYYNFPEQKVIIDFGGMPLINNSLDKKLSFTKIGRTARKFGIDFLFQFVIKNVNIDDYLIIMAPDNLDTPQMIRSRSVNSYDTMLEASFKKMAVRDSAVDKLDPLDVFMRKIAKYLLDSHDIELSNEQFEKDLNDVKDFTSKLINDGIIDDDMIPLEDALTLDELQNWTEKQFGDDIDLNWVEYLGEYFKSTKINITKDFKIYLLSSDSIYGILNLFRKTDPKIVKNFILLRIFLYMAPDSSLKMRKAFEEYYKAEGSEFYDRSDFCARKVLDFVGTAGLSFAITNEYVNHHFNINKIPEAVRIIKNIQEAFLNTLSTFDWIEKESKDAITKKLNNITVFLGYPDFVDDKASLDEFYDKLSICQSDNYGNAQRIRAFKKSYVLRQYQEHNLWTISPFEVNAFTTRASNRITAPISVLHDFYLQTKNSLFDYSRFGSIFSHELVHHFDTHGINYDQNGFQKLLLSNLTKQNFDAKKQCFIDQYSNYTIPELNLHLDGSQTLDENIADNGGLRHAYSAFKKIINTDFESEKYSLDQQFFINYATGWCIDESESYLRNLVENNEHSPDRFRVIGPLSNMEAFSEAFNCPVGSKMNPSNKCILW